MPHYIVAATRKMGGEPGILVVYAPDLEKAEKLMYKVRFTYDVEGGLTQRRPTEEEWARAISVAEAVRFAGFKVEEEEKWPWDRD